MDMDMFKVGRELYSYLSRGIYDLGRIVLALVPYHLTKRILDSRIIALDEVTINELHCERALA